MLLDGYHWQPWGELLHSVKTGETAFNYIHGMGLFDYLREHDSAAAEFNQAMTGNTATSGKAITRAYDFSGLQRIADIGGGHGLFLAIVLEAHPSMEGVLFDQPEVAAGAREILESAGVADRCEVIEGDFFVDVPAGCDAYVLRQIIHDWDDAQAIRILTNCRRAMQPANRLLVLERRISADYRNSLQVLHLDLEMLVNVGGYQRTDSEYSAIFADAGFQLTNIVPLDDEAQFSIFEGMPV